MSRRAFLGADIFDGARLHRDRALLLDNDHFQGLVAPDDLPAGYDISRLEGGTLLPGFVDLQVNGGGGVLFNEDTTCGGLITIAAAHATTGTRALLPTLITDTPERTRAALQAVEDAITAGVPGIIGIHLEGPHLAVARKGAHDAALIRPMEDADEALLLEAAARLPNVMVTLAPETVSTAQIARLSAAGIVISLGHSDCTMAQAMAAFDAGARCVTHLFNAMSQIGNREPGLVGAALEAPQVSAGLIADAIHVHPASMQIALRAKRGPGKVFLVTDAMSTVGSDIREFHLNGRRVLRRDGRLTLEDGTLAGADLDFPTALSVLRNRLALPPAEALHLATAAPAGLLPRPMGFGSFVPGAPWHGIRLDTNNRFDPAFF